MGILTKVTPDFISNAVGFKQGNLFAGEALADGDACYIKSDGLAWKCVNTAKDSFTTVDDNAGTDNTVWDISMFDGFSFGTVAVGEPVTLFGRDSILTYGSGLTPGALYYVAGAGNEGKLSDAAIGTNDSAIAKAVSATKIRVLR